MSWKGAILEQVSEATDRPDKTPYAEREGKSLDQRAVIVFTISGGKVTEALEMAEDTGEASEFWYQP